MGRAAGWEMLRLDLAGACFGDQEIVRTSNSSYSARKEIFPAIQLDLRLGEGFFESRHCYGASIDVERTKPCVWAFVGSFSCMEC